MIESPALARIASYVGADPQFESFAALEAHIRAVSAPFGALSDAQWETLARTTARAAPGRQLAAQIRSRHRVPFRVQAAQKGDLWPLWDAISCPTLVLRGAESDLLAPATAAAMRTRGPKPRLIEFAGIGHAPMLLDAEQIAPVADFLDAM